MGRYVYAYSLATSPSHDAHGNMSSIAAIIAFGQSAVEIVLCAIQTYRCTTDKVLLAVETTGSRLSVETAGASGGGPFPPLLRDPVGNAGKKHIGTTTCVEEAKRK